MAATAGDEKSPCGLPRHSAGHRGLVGKQGEAEGSSHLHGKMGPLASSEPLLWGNALHPFDFQLFRFLSCYFLFITQKRHTFVWRFCCASFSSTHFVSLLRNRYPEKRRNFVLRQNILCFFKIFSFAGSLWKSKKQAQNVASLLALLLCLPFFTDDSESLLCRAYGRISIPRNPFLNKFDAGFNNFCDFFDRHAHFEKLQTLFFSGFPHGLLRGLLCGLLHGPLHGLLRGLPLRLP